MRIPFVVFNGMFVLASVWAWVTPPQLATWDDLDQAVAAEYGGFSTDADVPTNQISCAKVLPDGYESYLRTGERLPVIRLNQEEKALVGDLQYIARETPYGTNICYSTSCCYPLDIVRLSYSEPVINGDSGNPAFLILNGEPVLLTVWTGGAADSGTSITALKDDLNAMMESLDPRGYQLTEIDLSVFSRLAGSW